MNQAGVKPITAHSPEAKGRVERIFETLQDRLVKEMRLAGISTIAEANAFLADYIPKFNAQFAVAPNKKADLHRLVNESAREKLPQTFSIQSARKINNDYTIMFKNHHFQLDRNQPTTVYKKDAVLPERPKKQINIALPALAKRKQSGWKPPINHPWRRSLAGNIQQKQTTFIN